MLRFQCNRPNDNDLGAGRKTHEFEVALYALQNQARAPWGHQLLPRLLLLRLLHRCLHGEVRRPIDARALGIPDICDVVDVLEAILLAPDDLLLREGVNTF